MASGSAMLAAAGALAIGGQMALEEAITPAAAAIAVFAALALAEALAPLHRGIAEIGRMRDAAARLAPTLEARQDPRSSVGHVGEVEPGLSLRGVSVAAPGSATALIQPIDLHVAPGEMVALTGKSGRGKSTLLNAISGLSLPLSGTILLDMELDVVELSRLQFAMTAMYHFLFVPLTLGLSILVAIMETVYVMTNRPIWRQMTKFWGTLFGINFVLGVATGITMEFQFGMNWSYYSHYVGDIFGAPLAIEGLMAFFLEATFVGLFFFGWDKLRRCST
jgi:hypothetical protein